MTIDTQINVVAPPTPQSPHPDTLSSVTALARFEFEPGKGNDGTKIMMVEWHDDDIARDKAGSWQVSWTGKSTIFPADDDPVGNVRRSYFLLPPGASIPPHITIAYTSPNMVDTEPLKMSVNPLPAIFTPELGATAKASGRKGVLHTIWAKRRLQVLEKEIRQEQELNLEGIALEMATAEKEWIEQNFGLGQQQHQQEQQQSKPLKLDLANLQNPATNLPNSPGLQSPRSPGGRRLTEKLKGLSLGTSERDLARGVNTPIRESHPLSPENGDMAHSSFSAFRERSLPSQQPQQTGKKVVAQLPPEYIKQQQSQLTSLDFATSNGTMYESQRNIEDATNNDSDDLFAIALSPRSPDDPKSPFSIPPSEIGAFSKIKGTQS